MLALPVGDTLPELIEDNMWMKCLICVWLHIFPGFSQLSGSEVSSTDDLIPCEKGWFYFKNKCYKLGGKKVSARLTQEQASAKCASEGGKLVTIQSKELNEFLMTFLILDVNANAWIGLNDKVNESMYSWEDSSEVNYTNWEPLEPSGPIIPHLSRGSKIEDCVEMIITSSKPNGMTGQWNDMPCSVPNPYICESKKSKKLTPDPRFCSDMQGGWKFRNSCYHLVNEKKSWEDAEQHCQDIYKGHLVTILDFTVDLFLEHILSNLGRELWIGIKIQDQSVQRWTSGWFVGYSEWDKDLGEDIIVGTCSLRSKHKLWKKVPCSKKYSFVCETSGVGPPVLKQPVKGVKCPELPEDWFDFGGEYCYFIDTRSRINWYQANFECISRGGSLASIHSVEENLILHQFVKNTQIGISIGLHRLIAYEDVFVWSDGSLLDYQNWDINEPNKENDKCCEMRTNNMKWNDVNCDEIKGYICSVRKGTSWKESLNVSKTSTECECLSGVSFTVLAGVIACILLVVTLIGIVIYFFRSGAEQKRKKSGVQLQPTAHRPKYRSSDVAFKEEDGTYEIMS